MWYIISKKVGNFLDNYFIIKLINIMHMSLSPALLTKSIQLHSKYSFCIINKSKKGHATTEIVLWNLINNFLKNIDENLQH